MFENYDGERLRLRRVRINAGGYDRYGKYWGVDRPLYLVLSNDGGIGERFRADNRENAKEIILKYIPGAKFCR